MYTNIEEGLVMIDPSSFMYIEVNLMGSILSLLWLDIVSIL